MSFHEMYANSETKYFLFTCFFFLYLYVFFRFFSLFLSVTIVCWQHMHMLLLLLLLGHDMHMHILCVSCATAHCSLLVLLKMHYTLPSFLRFFICSTWPETSIIFEIISGYDR